MARTIGLYAAAAALVAAGWLRLEQAPSPRDTAVWLVVLALLPALVRPHWGRAVAAVGVTLVALETAFGVSPFDARPFDDRHDFFGPLVSRLGDGILGFYDVSVPFVVAEEPLMHGVVLLAIFGFCLSVALAVAARRPLAAGLALLAGAGWPATLTSGAGLQRGALILAGVLALLAWARERPPHAARPALLAGVVVVVAAFVSTTSPAVAKDAFLSWKNWDPYDAPDDPVGVRYVWNANYDGIRFPKEATKVLSVDGPGRALYWRATTLDAFDQDRWVEDLATIKTAVGPEDVLSDPLLPPASRDRTRWVRADVEIAALRDRRLPGPSMPVRYEPRGMGLIVYRAGGVAAVAGGLEREDEYTVWAYAPRPTPAQLAASRLTARLRNTVHAHYLELAPGASVLPFRAQGRDERVRNLLTSGVFGTDLRPYEPLFRQARELVGDAENAYAAVVALEAWFRTQGGFEYDEQPPVPLTEPPLVAFVTGHKRGYCQHFAGAMALMLRYLGIPARVAAGFTSGSFNADRRRWTVTDHDAHAWVEVWFDGWGWLPFDPTPGRGQLSGTYTSAAPNFDAEGARDVAGRGGIGGPSLAILGEALRSRLEGTTGGRDVPGDVAVGTRVRDTGSSLLRLLALVAVVLLAAIAFLKLVIRRARYLTRDPRRIAAACRAELVDILADQRVDVSRSSTLAELGETVGERLYVDADAFVAAASVARFAPPSEARAASREARRELRALRRLLRRRLSVVERARGLVSVRSLGLTG